jgi:Lamin Tail Domain
MPPSAGSAGTTMTGGHGDAAVNAPGDAASDVSRGDAAGDASRGDAAGDVSRGDAALTLSRPDASADVSRGDAALEVGEADAPSVADLAPRETASEATPGARAPRAGEVVIDEVLVDPAGNDLGHEWLEIVNVTGETLELATLHLSDDVTEVAIDAGLLAPGARLVLGQSADHAHNGDAPVDLAYGTRLSLNNGAERIALCLGACADGLEFDAFAWTVAWGDAYIGHAIIRSAGATCAAQDAYGTGGNFGTPGRPNPPCPPPLDGGVD